MKKECHPISSRMHCGLSKQFLDVILFDGDIESLILDKEASLPSDKHWSFSPWQAYVPNTVFEFSKDVQRNTPANSLFFF